MRKEKQIEKMMKHCPFYEKGKCILLEEKEVECDMNCDLCDFAKSLYNADYRKQSEGEWGDCYPTTTKSHKFVCSACKAIAYYPQPTRTKNVPRACKYNFCPNCGAKMKGGEE